MGATPVVALSARRVPISGFGNRVMPRVAGPDVCLHGELGRTTELGLDARKT